MNNLFNDDNSLTDHGHQFLITFNAVIKHIINSDTVVDMSETEIKTLGKTLTTIVSDAIDKQINNKRESANEFGAMTDEKFENYLQEKYGKVWMFCTLTTEELDRVQMSENYLTQEKIQEILTKDIENLIHLPKPGVRIPSGSIWDPKPGRRYK